MSAAGGGPVMTVALEAEIARLRADLDAAKALVDKSSREMGQIVKRNGLFGGALDEMKRSVRTVGDLLNYAQVGLGGLVALSESFRGNFDASQQALERLPTVFGEAARFGRVLFEAIVGTAQTMKLLADTENEVNEQDKRRERLKISQQAIARYEYEMSRMRETDPVKRIEMERERAIQEINAEFKKRGDESGKRFSEEMQKVREAEDARSEKQRSLDAARRAAAGIYVPGEAQQPVTPDALETRRANAAAMLKREMEQDLREQEAALQKITEEFSRKRDAAFTARNAESRRKTLRDEEKALREQLRMLGSVSGRDFLTTSNTAIGGFTSAQRNAGTQIAKHLQQQTEIQRRIEQNTAEQARILEEIKDAGGGWQ